MNKSDIIDSFSVSTGRSKAVGKRDLNDVLDTLSRSFREHARTAGPGKIVLQGFGTFEIVASPEREFRNPRTGETVTREAEYTVRFKPGSDLKELLNR